MIIGALIVLWLLGPDRGVLGAMVGGFVGTLAAAGLASAAKQGELAAVYTPAGMVIDLLPLAAVALVLAFVAPYATFAAGLAWTGGSVVAAAVILGTDQVAYLAPLLVNIVVAAAIVRIAGRQISSGSTSR